MKETIKQKVLTLVLTIAALAAGHMTAETQGISVTSATSGSTTTRSTDWFGKTSRRT